MVKEEKCIIFSRVSTQIQTLEQQEHVLITAAKADGYSEDNMIVISETESAVKNNMSERLGLTKAKEAILNNNVKILYAFEISRLARRLDVFYDFRTFLVEHHVQLRILNPDVRLLSKDGTIDENFTLVFSIFASLAEQEARLMKTRLKRGKSEKRAVNKHCDGKPCYGYVRQKDGSISINEEEAEIIRHIFFEYNSGKTVDEISRQLILNGTVDKDLAQTKRFCFHILHNIIYKGGSSADNVYQNTKVVTGYTYPAIVDEYDYDKADKTFKKRNCTYKKNTKHVAFCRGILVNQNGEPFSVHSYHSDYFRTTSTKDSISTVHISQTKLDPFIWDYVVRMRSERPVKSIDERKRELTVKMKEQELVLSEIESGISDIDEKIKRIEYRIIAGKLNESLGDEMESKLNRDREKLTDSAAQNKLILETLKSKLSNLSNDGFGRDTGEMCELTDEEKAAVIRAEIKQIVAIRKPDKSVHLGILTNECGDPDWVIL